MDLTSIGLSTITKSEEILPQYSVIQNSDFFTENNLTTNARYGHKIVENSLYVVVSAPNFNYNDIPNSGAVFIYKKTPSGLQKEKEIYSTYPQENGNFGWSLSVSEKILAVGAPNEYENKGSVYTWVYENNEWVENFSPTNASDNRIKISNGTRETSGNFGFSLFVTNRKIYIGSPNAYGQNINDDRYGLVYIYDYDISNKRWNINKILNSSSEQKETKFGFSLDVNTDMGLAVGAPYETINGFENQGAVYLFYPVNGKYIETYKITPDANHTFEIGFGKFVNFKSNRLLIGIPSWPNGGATSLWVGSWYNWKRVKLVEEQLSDTDNQGIFVDQDTLNNIIFVSNTHYDNNKGSVLVYETVKGNIIPAKTKMILINDGNTSEYFGNSISIYGNDIFISSLRGNGGFYSFKLVIN